jgi:hypothetical protein
MHFQGQKVPGGSAAKPIPSSAGPSGRGPHMNRGGSAPEAQAQNVDPLIGRKVMSRWPEDNSFYEAVIYEYDAETVRFYYSGVVTFDSSLQLFLREFIAGPSCTGL